MFDVEYLRDPATFKPIIRLRSMMGADVTPDDILVTALYVIRDLAKIGESVMKEYGCNECHEKVYAKLRTLTLEQLRELVWHSDEAQAVLQEKIAESGMQALEKKWDDAMSVVKVG